MTLFAPTLRANGKLVACQKNQVLLEALQSAGLLVESACSGRGACGLCQVRVAGGKPGEPTAIEARYLSDMQLRAGLRLACQMRLVASVDLVLPNLCSPRAPSTK